MAHTIRTVRLLIVLAAPLSASSPGCLLVNPTVPAGAYSGTAAPSGAPGGVFDDCSNFGATPWDISNPMPQESLWFGDTRSSFGFWVGGSGAMSFRFLLGGELQYDTGMLAFDPAVATWWQWTGGYDQVDISGAHVLTLYFLDEPVDDLIDARQLQPLLGAMPGLEDPLAASTVPEPATITLLASGLLGLAGASRRRRLEREG